MTSIRAQPQTASTVKQNVNNHKICDIIPVYFLSVQSNNNKSFHCFYAQNGISHSRTVVAPVRETYQGCLAGKKSHSCAAQTQRIVSILYPVTWRYADFLVTESTKSGASGCWGGWRCHKVWDNHEAYNLSKGWATDLLLTQPSHKSQFHPWLSWSRLARVIVSKTSPQICRSVDPEQNTLFLMYSTDDYTSTRLEGCCSPASGLTLMPLLTVTKRLWRVECAHGTLIGNHQKQIPQQCSVNEIILFFLNLILISYS